MIFLGFFQRSTPVACPHLQRSAARVGIRLAWQCDGCGDLDVTDTVLVRPVPADPREAAYHASNQFGR